MKETKAEHYYSENQESRLVLKKITAKFFGKTIELNTVTGVFSYAKVDRGTEILIENCIIKDGWSVLDLGCGYGIVGITIAKSFPNAKIVMTDINQRAVKTARTNAKLNNLENTSVLQGNCYEAVEKNLLFDTILLNPPQSAGKELCISMIKSSKKYLKEDGLLQIVARHNKGGKSLSEEMINTFQNLEIRAKKSGYWVYVSRK